MKIVISPSKTQSNKIHPMLEDKALLFPKEHRKVLSYLRKMTKKDIALNYKINNDLLNQTYKNIKKYNELETFQAFPSFNGLVFKYIDLDNYDENDIRYIEKNLFILDAFYGLLEPGTKIKNYRLDMKTRIGINLYNLFDLSKYFKDEVTINLASDEFSKMIKEPLINIHFREEKDGKFVNQATYAKMARGLFLDFMVTEKIEEVNSLKKFNRNNYSYNETLSDMSNLFFTRKAQK